MTAALTPSSRRGAPRFDLRLEHGEAHLRSRGSWPFALGEFEELELRVGDLPAALDLRAGALAFRDRRTAALKLACRLSGARLERFAAVHGTSLEVECAGPADPARDPLTFGLSFWDEHGALTCLARGAVEAGALELHLGAARALPTPRGPKPQARLVRVARRFVASLNSHAPLGELVARVVEREEGRVSLEVEYALESLLGFSLLSAGWRLPRTLGLRGALVPIALGKASARPKADLRVSVSIDGSADGSRDGSAEGSPSASAPAALSAPIAWRQSADPLGPLAAWLSGEELDGPSPGAAMEGFRRFERAEPSALLRADAALGLAEALLRRPPQAERDEACVDLCVAALVSAPRSVAVAERVLQLSERDGSALLDERLLSAVFACPLPSVQKAAIAARAAAALAEQNAARAGLWLARARPFAPSSTAILLAEVALLQARGRSGSDGPPRGQLAAAHARAAGALLEAGEHHAAAGHFADAARAHEREGSPEEARRMWQACVAAAPAERLRPSMLVSAARALHDDGRAPEALRLLATLLVTEPGRAPDVDAELDQALVDAEAFHRGLPDGAGAPALFAARRELLAPS